MPTYQYACTACAEQLEAVQSFSDAALTTCPACGGTLRKVFSAVGVVFKGSGFYKTDSRSASTSDSGKSDKGKGDKGKGDKPAETAAKSDSPAATSTAKSEPAKTSSTPASTPAA